MTLRGSISRAGRGAPALVAGAAMAVALCGCEPPFDLGQPTTRALESGAAQALSSASSFELAGTYGEAGKTWTVDMQLARPNLQHTIVSTSGTKLEAIIVGEAAYFRGQQYLAQHMGADPLSQSLARAAGNAWWKGSAATLPRLPDLTDGPSFQATFLGSVVTQRHDHVAVDGVAAVELAGPRADVFIAADPPYRPLRVQMKKGVDIDGVIQGDLKYSNFNQDFQIAAPVDVIDFSNLSTLPPIYTVVSVDPTGCGSPCVVAATVKNLGGMSGATSPSTITFTMTDSASGQAIGSCQAIVAPDVGYNATTIVRCAIPTSSPVSSSVVVTASPYNPGRA